MPNLLPQIQWLKDHEHPFDMAYRIDLTEYDITAAGKPGTLGVLVDTLGLKPYESMNNNESGQTWWRGIVDGFAVLAVEL